MARIYYNTEAGFAEHSIYTIDAEIKENRLVLNFNEEDYSYSQLASAETKKETFDIDETEITRTFVYEAICKVFKGDICRSYGWPEKEEDIDISGLIHKR